MPTPITSLEDKEAALAASLLLKLTKTTLYTRKRPAINTFVDLKLKLITILLSNVDTRHLLYSEKDATILLSCIRSVFNKTARFKSFSTKATTVTLILKF
jgi:hypothetical protein